MLFVGQGSRVCCLPGIYYLLCLQWGGAEVTVKSQGMKVSQELSEDLDTQEVAVDSFIGELEK